MVRFWGGQSIRLNRSMEGDHEYYDTQVFHLSKYTSNKKKPLRKIPIRSAVGVKTIHKGSLFMTNKCKLR